MDERLERILPKKVIKIIENENFALYVFLILILLPLVFLLINLLEIYPMILNNIPYIPVDFSLFNHILTIIIGTVAIITITRYYLYIRSVDYLFIAYFIFGIVAWEIFLVYASLVDPLYIVFGPGPTALNSGIHSGFFLRNLTRQPYFWGMFALFLQNVRMRSWKEYHLIMKAVIVFLFIEILIFFIADFITSNYIFEADTLELFISRVNETNAIVYNLTTLISQFFFPGTTSCLTISIVVYLFVIFSYITVKPEYQTQSIKISRIIWIFYALFGLSVFLGGYLSMQGVYSIEWETVFQQFLAIVTLLQLILLFIIQFFIPESLLITDFQIMRAKKMYEIIESKPQPAMMGLDRVQDYLREVFKAQVSMDG